jgi:hypothetical protein
LDRGHGYLQFWRSVFDRRAPKSLSQVEAALGGAVKQGNTTRDVSSDLLDALSDAYREAASKIGTGETPLPLTGVPSP